jgi:hypothetical protein
MTAMRRRLDLKILPQPDNSTCGPTCLHAVYRYYGDTIPLEQVIRESPRLEDGGTLGALLGGHALQRGYRVTIYTYNLKMFDPTWFESKKTDLSSRLLAQSRAKGGSKFKAATRAYLNYLQLGGEIRFEDLTPELLRGHLRRGVPILTGLSATYLYRSARESPGGEYDAVKGLPVGHFVVLRGYDPDTRKVLVADPFLRNPKERLHYDVGMQRLLSAILLGVVTYDANLLIIERAETRNVDADRRQ